MMSENTSFSPFTRELLDRAFSLREGEVKIGQKAAVFDDFGLIKTKFVILGVSEDVGPRANMGAPGSDRSFDVFVNRFLNMQSNRFFDGSDCLIMGKVIGFSSPDASIPELRACVEEIDSMVFEYCVRIFSMKAIPIVIGGGHNNAYPIIKAYHSVFGLGLDVINLDPHADFRPLEGRHSGNSFSYAMSQGMLSSYHVIGLHKQYNSESMLLELENNKCFFSFYEDYLMGVNSFVLDFSKIKRILGFGDTDNDAGFGCEIDMDAIKGMPSSAFTPSGFSLDEVRAYLGLMNVSFRLLYLHLPEAAPLSSREDAIVGKSLSYLVSDFCASYRF